LGTILAKIKTYGFGQRRKTMSIKVGDRVVIPSNDHVWRVTAVEEESNRAELISIYNKKPSRVRLNDLKKTAKNPVLLVETYGPDWRDNVCAILEKGSIRFKTFHKERQSDVTLFFVDSKKLSVAKKAMDEFYSKQSLACEAKTEENSTS
jgi:hypothetical protein